MDFHDPVSSITHLLTAVWAAFATLILLRLTRGHGPGRWAVGYFGVSMVLLYLASGLYHGLRYECEAERLLFQRLDKSAIFLLIAGTYTPVFVYLLDGRLRASGLAVLFAIAAAGVASLWLFPDLPHARLVAVYVGAGLVGLAALPRIVSATGWPGLAWVAAAAGIYLCGATVEVLKWPVLVPGYIGPHELLHVTDICGTLAAFVFVTRYVIRRPPPGREERTGRRRSSRVSVISAAECETYAAPR
jgi:hemolysin III